MNSPHEGEFERMGFGETGRFMDIATHNARVAERARHNSAQDWRDARRTILAAHIAHMEPG